MKISCKRFFVTGQYEQRDGNSALQCYLPTLRKRTSPDMGALVCGVLFQFYFVVYLMMPFLLFSWWSAFSGAACAGNCTHSHSCQRTADQTRSLSCCCNKEWGCTEMLLFELLCSECSRGFLFSWLEVLLPFSLFCLSEKMTGVKVGRGGTRVDSLEK